MLTDEQKINLGDLLQVCTRMAAGRAWDRCGAFATHQAGITPPALRWWRRKATVRERFESYELVADMRDGNLSSCEKLAQWLGLPTSGIVNVVQSVSIEDWAAAAQLMQTYAIAFGVVDLPGRTRAPGAPQQQVPRLKLRSDL